ncbi:hypothetical protein GGH13_009579, partial [Coemansia sp. S155-1]
IRARWQSLIRPGTCCSAKAAYLEVCVKSLASMSTCLLLPSARAISPLPVPRFS